MEAQGDTCDLTEPVGVFVQLTLGFLALWALVLKWGFFEKPRRNIVVFLLDTGKQTIGGLWAHLLNVLIAYYLAVEGDFARLVAGSQFGSIVILRDLYDRYRFPPNGRWCLPPKDDACVWYSINIVTDSVVSTAIYFGVLHVLSPWLKRKYGVVSGVYYDQQNNSSVPEDLITCLNHWMVQTGLWCLLVTLTRAAVFIVVLSGRDAWFELFSVALHRVLIGIHGYEKLYRGKLDVMVGAREYTSQVSSKGGQTCFVLDPRVELIVVVLVLPLIVNSVQFLVQDYIIRFNPGKVPDAITEENIAKVASALADERSFKAGTSMELTSRLNDSGKRMN